MTAMVLFGPQPPERMPPVRRKQLTRELAYLRVTWRVWRRADQRYLHFDYCLAACPARCGTCEGCATAAYRAERMTEIRARAAGIKAELEPA